MLPIVLGEKLGCPIKTSVKTTLYGIGSQAVHASPGEIKLKINHTEIITRCYFVYSKESLLLLGRLDIFDRFSITFDFKKREVVFNS